VAIAASLLFSTAAAYFFLRAGDGGGLGSLVFGGACFGLAVGCRPNLIVLAAALPLLSARGAGSGAAVRPDGGRGGRVWREVLAVAVPLALMLVPLTLYNHARFGSWTEFGASYQLIETRRISWLDFRASPYVLYYLFLAPFSFAPTSRTSCRTTTRRSGHRARGAVRRSRPRRSPRPGAVSPHPGRHAVRAATLTRPQRSSAATPPSCSR
jgi:hypothetical protein